MCFEDISQVKLMFKFEFTESVCNVFKYVYNELYFVFCILFLNILQSTLKFAADLVPLLKDVLIYLMLSTLNI